MIQASLLKNWYGLIIGSCLIIGGLSLVNSSLLLAQDDTGAPAGVGPDDLVLAEQELFGTRLGLGPEDEISPERSIYILRRRVWMVGPDAMVLINAVLGTDDRFNELHDQYNETGWSVAIETELGESLNALRHLEEFFSELGDQLDGVSAGPLTQPDLVSINLDVDLFGAAWGELNALIEATEFAIASADADSLLLNGEYWEHLNDLLLDELEPQLQLSLGGADTDSLSEVD